MRQHFTSIQESPMVHSGITMSLLRNVRRLVNSGRNCHKIVTTQQRNYAEMSFTFASPGDVYYNNANVKQVDVPSFSGSFGILPEHVPVLAVMKPGVVTVYENDGTAKKFFASSGSITVNDDSSVQILAEEAVPLEDLDAQAIRDGLSRASSEAGSATTEQAKAAAQIEHECYEALQKALE